MAFKKNPKIKTMLSNMDILGNGLFWTKNNTRPMAKTQQATKEYHVDWEWYLHSIINDSWKTQRARWNIRAFSSSTIFIYVFIFHGNTSKFRAGAL